jgi:hypothetical protein
MDSGGFGSTRSDPVYHYHSVFDSERFQEVYADPGFVKHVGIEKSSLGHSTHMFLGCRRKELGTADAPSCQRVGSSLQYDTLRV